MKSIGRFNVGEDYAVMYFDALSTPLRPLRAVWNGESMEVHDPDDPVDFPTKSSLAELVVLGSWGEFAGQGASETWAQMSERQMAHVRRQRDLAERLTKIGIKRDPEPYIHRNRVSNHVELSLVLNYDEIDLLLRRGGA